MANPVLEMKPFHFKQFSLFHHKSTMKVGTDSILLGSWCNVKNSNKILDIGTGCGIIALLLASRTNAIIDAVELDKNSAFEAATNFKNSKFGNRLNIINCDFMDYVNTSTHSYELIISNPPFFSNDLNSPTLSRNSARHIANLNHNNLCIGVKKLLVSEGRFYLVLPCEIANEFIVTAQNHGLYLHKKQLVYPKTGSAPNRINMEFRFGFPTEVMIDEITIRNTDNQHSSQYKELVKEFLVGI
ncbi:MAG: methyltransferase [Bacteroidetes bacterium]|nr:methyltransferase [Bacteroidota bacterium]